MNNRILRAVLATIVLAVPVASFAQTSRAQVEAQLTQLEKAGYSPSANSSDYPADIQAAEAKVSMSDQSSANTSQMNSAGGVSDNGQSGSGHGCVGPVDFCTPYFGS